MGLCLFAKQLSSRKPGTICIINWVFFNPNMNHYHSDIVWHTWCNFRASSDKLFKSLDHAMILAQYFFSFFEEKDLPITSLVDVTLSDYYLITFSILWQTTQWHPSKTQFYLNMSFLYHHSSLAYILCV